MKAAQHAEPQPVGETWDLRCRAVEYQALSAIYTRRNTIMAAAR